MDAKRIEIARLALANKRINVTFADTAKALEVNDYDVRNAVREYRAYLDSTRTIPFAPEYTFERHDIRPQLEGDFIVVGDIHVPTTNWIMLDMMCDLAKKHGIDNLLIVGDLFNMDALSSYDHIVRPTSLRTELSVARKSIQHMLKSFKKIYLFAGNHETRISRMTKGEMSVTVLWELVQNGIEAGRVIGYADTAAWVYSGGLKWRVTHQRNYSKIKGRVAAALCAKYESNVILHHQHHTAIIRSDNNRYTGIDNGGLHDDALMHYVQHTDSTSTVMCNSFTLLRDGVGHIFTPYDTITDWSMWGLDASKLFAYERDKQAVRFGERLQIASDVLEDVA